MTDAFCDHLIDGSPGAYIGGALAQADAGQKDRCAARVIPTTVRAAPRTLGARVTARF